MRQYLDLMRHVKLHGSEKTDRTGTGTRSVFGYQMRFDLQQGFPLVTTKKLHLKSIIHELIWFLDGSTNIKYLKENGVSIWDDWADADGNLGPIYGYQLRSWPAPNGEHIDQITQVLQQIKHDPDSRRMIVSAWNVGDIPRMKLPPCRGQSGLVEREARIGHALYTAAATMPKTTCVAAVTQSRAAANQGKTNVKPYILIAYKDRPNAAPASRESGVLRRDMNTDRAKPYAIDSAK